MEPVPKLRPESLVARIVAELQENPDAQRMLLRVLLTNEFLGMPARLDRIERDVAELKVDVAELKVAVAGLQTDVAGLKTDVADLKTNGASLKATNDKLVDDMGEVKGQTLELHTLRKIRSLVCQKLWLRRPKVLQSALQPAADDFDDAVARAADDGRIGERQENRILATDVILQAQRRRERTPVWVAVEVSYRVHAHDIDRARVAAETLATVFGQAVVAVVVGRLIDPVDRRRAADGGVEYLEIPA